MNQVDDQGAEPTDFEAAANALAIEHDTDLILIQGPIGHGTDTRLIEALLAHDRRSKALVILVTDGGDPRAAYRMARCLQQKYANGFSLFVTGRCKSAGTLIALGAQELVFGPHGELGPLDVQMPTKDEIFELQSGQTVTAALDGLEDRAFEMLEDYFLQISAKSGGQITFRTASEISAELVRGLLAPVYAQINPLFLGEAVRAMSIGREYGKRLISQTYNLKGHEAGLENLVAGYPDHGFAIDRAEAAEIFERVRTPNELEHKIERGLEDLGRAPMYAVDGTQTFIQIMNLQVPGEEPPKDDEQEDRAPQLNEIRAATGPPEDAADQVPPSEHDAISGDADGPGLMRVS